MSRPRASSGSPWVTGTLAFAVAWWVFDLLVLRSGTPDRSDDTWELGVAARALLEGHGFRTPVIPLPLWPLRDAANTVPFFHGPLLPLLLAPFITLFGPGTLDAIAWIAAAGAVAVVPPLVRLGERCGHAAIGVGAAVVWTLAPLTLHAVHHDASFPIAAALLVAGLELLARPAPRPLAAGVALGLGALARPELLGALPIAALAAGPGVGGLLLGALAPLLPWGILVAVAGRPPHVDLVAAQTFALHPRALGRALLLPTGALGWLAVLGAGFGIGTRETRRIALLTTGLALVPVAFLSLARADARALVAFLPLYALGAARGLDGLGSWLPAWTRRPRFTIGLLVLVLVPVTGPAMREEAVHARDARTALATERSRLSTWSAALDSTAAWSTVPGSSGDESLVFSDSPGLVAWTTERSTVGSGPGDLPLLPPTGTAMRPARPDSLHTWFHASQP